MKLVKVELLRLKITEQSHGIPHLLHLEIPNQSVGTIRW
jgi:hypothetical protein